MKKGIVKVLLIEDDEDDYIVFRQLLEKAAVTRYTIDWEPSVDNALEKIKLREHDIYFIDYQLGKNTGIEILRQLKDEVFNKPVIMLTGQTDYSIALDAIKAGAEDYLIKGEMTTLLLGKAIHYAIERKQTYLERQEDARREAERDILERRKDEFISMASHELKTPLTSQKLFISTLQNILKNYSDTKPLEITQKIARQTEKLEKLVRDLLDVSKIQAGKLSLDKIPTNLNELARIVVDDVQGTTPQHIIKINGKIDREVYVDKDRITQVFTNLITNAIKYSPREGDIIINLSEENNTCKVSVRDYGIGIDKEHLDKIFKRFFRVEGRDEKTFPGMGVGLYISSKIIDQHNGKIWVESEKGKGTTFYFTLPLA